MNPRRPISTPSEPLINRKLLVESVRHSIHKAQQQIARSRSIVTHSRDIIARVRISLAHSRRIQQGIARGPARHAADGSALQ
jgi:hypothetical protein